MAYETSDLIFSMFQRDMEKLQLKPPEALRLWHKGRKRLEIL
jgi:hypothetical protein